MDGHGIGRRRLGARAAGSRKIAIIATLAAAVLVVVVLVRPRRRPVGAPPGPGPATQLGADAVREHNAEVLWVRARKAAAIHSWAAAGQHLDRLKAKYADTRF